VHGVDVSRNAETANFTRIQECGGSFVYIRLSYGNDTWAEDRWRPLWLRAAYDVTGGDARDGSLVRGGYHVLAFSTKTQQAAKERTSEWMAGAGAEAQGQAREYVGRLADVLKSGHDRSMLPVALVIDGAEMPDIGTARELYRHGACAWFAEVQKLLPYRMAHVVLRARTSLLLDLHMVDLACEKVAPIRFWLTHYTGDGGEPRESSASLYQECAEARRCLFHKYTARGRLTLAGGKEYVGLVRFLGGHEQFKAALIDVRR